MKQNGTIRVLVVDDEALARSNLTALLGKDPDVGHIAECESGLEAIEEIKSSKPDLIFLDVQMPECDGFDMLEILGEDQLPKIIFVTAYDEYALRAFETGALDYLLKPFDDGRFHRALNRAKKSLIHETAQVRRHATRLAIKSRDQVQFLNVSDIEWIGAAGYYACVHVGSETHILRRTLIELAKSLGDEEFLRIHRSTIVNLHKVRMLELQPQGEYEVVLKSNVRLQWSRRFRKDLQNRLYEMSLRSDRN